MILECFCIGGSTQWNWDAIGAMGNLVVAAAAVAAVWWGIKQTNLTLKSKALLGIDILTSREGDILRTYAINKGHSPIRFSNVHIKHKKTKNYLLGYTFYRENEQEPTEPNNRKTHGFSLIEFRRIIEENTWSKKQDYVLEFTDSANNIFSKRFKYDHASNTIE
jgi:hypothetical protein